MAIRCGPRRRWYLACRVCGEGCCRPFRVEKMRYSAVSPCRPSDAFIYLSIRLSIYLSVYLSIYLYYIYIHINTYIHTYIHTPQVSDANTSHPFGSLLHSYPHEQDSDAHTLSYLSAGHLGSVLPHRHLPHRYPCPVDLLCVKTCGCAIYMYI